MPIPLNRMYRPDRLNLWFALGAVLLTAAILGMIWIGHHPPWRIFRRDHLANQAALAHLESLGTVREGGAAGLLSRSSLRSEPALGDRCTTCHLAIADASFSKANLARALERAIRAIQEASGVSSPALPDSPPGDGRGLVRPPPDGRSSVARPVSADDAPAVLPGRVTENWKELTEEQRDDHLEALCVTVNEYLASVGVEPLRIGQPLLAHSHLDMFVSPDSPHPMARMGCSICHEGNGPETDFVLAGHCPPTRERASEWKERYYVRRMGVVRATFEEARSSWDRPMLANKHVQAGCAGCHTRIADLGEHKGRRWGSVLNLGRHLFTAIGCVNCHPVDTLADSRRVGPDLTGIESKLSPEFAMQWVFSPISFRPSTRMPHFFEQENNRGAGATPLDPDPIVRSETEVIGMVDYLFALSDEWEPISAGDGVTGRPAWGRSLFKTIGCLACHADVTANGTPGAPLFGQQGVGNTRSSDTPPGEGKEELRPSEGKEDLRPTRGKEDHFPSRGKEDLRTVRTRFAPELSGVGSKVSFEWLYSWLIDPSHYAVGTKMPSMRLTPGEAADLAAYLKTLTNEVFSRPAFGKDKAHREMADQLLEGLLRQQRSPDRTKTILSDETGELTDMLVSLLERSLGVRRARELVLSVGLQDRKWLLLGRRMISHYGCFGCHNIRGFEQSPPPGTALSAWGAKPVSRLDFGLFSDGTCPSAQAAREAFSHVYPLDADQLVGRSPTGNLLEQIMRTRAAFAEHKLLNPRIWDRGRVRSCYNKLKMPNFYLSGREVDALVTFLLSRQPARVSPRVQVDYRNTPAGVIAEGRDLVGELNCIGCHAIDGHAAGLQSGDIGLGAEPLFADQRYAPPSLRAEGAKVQTGWLLGFLDEVEAVRPYLTVRMPSFNLSGEQRTTLARYFVGLSQVEAAGWASPTTPTVANEAGGQCSPHLIELSNVSYPAVEPQSDPPTADELADGERLFYSLNCLACHLFGNRLLPGANVNRMGPDLQPIHRRLRRVWARRWLEKPSRMRPGTIMPDLFGDGTLSAFARLSPADRRAIASGLNNKALLDDPSGQIDAIIDFLYDAGRRGLDKPQPPGP